MLSLETARRLKDLGLKWNPVAGDCFSYGENIWAVVHHNGDKLELVTIGGTGSRAGFTSLPIAYLLEEEAWWLPSLEQILEEIWQRGYDVQLQCPTPPLGQYVRLALPVGIPNWDLAVVDVWDSDATEAAAQALVKILKKVPDGR